MGYSKLVVVVSVLVPFLLNISKRISSTLTIPTVLTRSSSPPLSSFNAQRECSHSKSALKAKCWLGDEHRFVKTIMLS